MFDPRHFKPCWRNPNHVGNYHVDTPPIPPSRAHEFPCKDSYIGAPVKAVMPAGAYCHPCGHPGGPRNGAICSVVVDDANNIVYLYGDVTHENYHVPGDTCVAYATVGSAGFVAPTIREVDEFWEGVQSENTIVLDHLPKHNNTFMVFLNGVKQTEGAEKDFLLEGNKIKFNFYELLPEDRVEVMYTYEDGE